MLAAQLLPPSLPLVLLLPLAEEGIAVEYIEAPDPEAKVEQDQGNDRGDEGETESSLGGCVLAGKLKKNDATRSISDTPPKRRHQGRIWGQHTNTPDIVRTIKDELLGKKTGTSRFASQESRSPDGPESASAVMVGSKAAAVDRRGC